MLRNTAQRDEYTAAHMGTATPWSEPWGSGKLHVLSAAQTVIATTPTITPTPAHAYTDQHPHPYSHCGEHAHAHHYCNSHANRHRHKHSHSHCYRHTDGHHHPDTDRYPPPSNRHAQACTAHG